MSALLLLAAGLASYGAFVCLALAMRRHWAAANGQTAAFAPHQTWLRFCGFLQLGLSYALCVYRDGPSFGSVLWILLISAAAIAVALTLAWRPRLFLR
ncbi:DUF3325 domain-containing protein [Polaromonas sp. SM01]|uniref:DUF3325 domain-containing protein n=1 Tax=Polaromonas sp. SM01 TaxID=3085630 RepID=UPI002981C384|nr:DUF3325 domain-containing protein [Polaromonas sp. SM01]MDW5443642.1 DUF3325 domain-containing protein [Polaromonas sp. SM01]